MDVDVNDVIYILNRVCLFLRPIVLIPVPQHKQITVSYRQSSFQNHQVLNVCNYVSNIQQHVVFRSLSVVHQHQ